MRPGNCAWLKPISCTCSTLFLYCIKAWASCSAAGLATTNPQSYQGSKVTLSCLDSEKTQKRWIYLHFWDLSQIQEFLQRDWRLLSLEFHKPGEPLPVPPPQEWDQACPVPPGCSFSVHPPQQWLLSFHPDPLRSEPGQAPTALYFSVCCTRLSWGYGSVFLNALLTCYLATC